MAKLAIIVYHKLLGQYPAEWITTFKESIENQTHWDFTIYEHNYNGGDERIFKESIYSSFELNNHAEAQNYLIDLAFDHGFDYVFNTNCDDFYSLDRIEKQLIYLEHGYDIVSSNFTLLDSNGEAYHTHTFDKLDIKAQLAKEHNVICHPVVAYSKHFWEFNRYRPFEIPYEDMKLWQRSIGSFRFIILEDVLCFHRVHSSSVGNSTK